MTGSAHPYAELTPDRVLDALESVGLRGDGRLQALGSYENRVYQIGIEDAPAVVAKFYRPGRWSDAAIEEEHAFVAELAAREVPVVAPLALAGGTLHTHGIFRFAVYPRCGGRAPELGNRETLEWMGRFIGRIHAVGAQAPFRHRGTLDLATFGIAPRDWLLAHDFVPPDLLDAWRTIAAQALDGVRRCFERAGDVRTLRLHGDCHAGNVLWIEHGATRGPHFVDFDDARTGPAVQDLWMLLSGDRADMTRQLGDVLTGLPQLLRLRSARAGARRGAAHAAPAALLGMAGATLGRPGVSRGVPVVRHPALLAGPHPRAARAGRADGRAAAGIAIAFTSPPSRVEGPGHAGRA